MPEECVTTHLNSTLSAALKSEAAGKPRAAGEDNLNPTLIFRYL